MTEALMISNVLLWIAVLAALVGLFALARQIGVLYERVAPMGALMMDTGPKVGEASKNAGEMLKDEKIGRAHV